jgi:predicted RNA-binding Zn-ribbon protein involved in translation (DUF1610 family)
MPGLPTLAYLADRVQLEELGYQTYGTQYTVAGGTRVLRTVNEPESVDERRAIVGLPPLAEQDRAMAERYGPPKLLISTRRPVLVRCPKCGWQISGESHGRGKDFLVVCTNCGKETTLRMG